MHTMSSKNRLSTLFLRTAALGVFTAAATLGLQAQQPAVSAIPAQPALDLQASLIAPLDLSAASSSSSSSSSDTDAAPTETFDPSPAAAMQPPPRRRYRRPNYSDSHTNPDGSNKYTFMVGGGFTLPTGGTHNYATPGWKFQVGGGRNFNKTLGVLLQFDYDKMGIQTSTLNNQLALYNSLGAQDQDGNQLSSLGGYIHDWSFSLDPIVNYYTSDTWGAYVTGGIGFYHKATVFTTPATGEYCDYYYGCYEYEANQPIDSYNSNAFGVNGGFGFTYKLSRWSGTRLYGEARYVWTDNSPRRYDVDATSTYFNAFPQASARTTYIPVTFGIRF
jgi:hypothetical protein